METKKIFVETSRLGSKIVSLHAQLEGVNRQCLELMEICPHEIVFQYVDYHSRTSFTEESYFCPACGKSLEHIHLEQLQDFPFKDSRIIPLLNLSLAGSSQLYRTIRNEIYQNMDFYYNPDIPVEQLSHKMETLLKDQERRYVGTVEILKKTKKFY